MPTQIHSLDLIKHLGFHHVGNWHIDETGLNFILKEVVKNKEQSLYAFVSGTEVLYLGKSTGVFIKRIRGYKRPGISQPTNNRINPKLSQMIQSKKDISIYHFECVEKFMFRDIPLNIAAALEDALIAKISPQWNIVGKKKAK